MKKNFAKKNVFKIHFNNVTDRYRIKTLKLSNTEGAFRYLKGLIINNYLFEEERNYCLN